MHKTRRLPPGLSTSPQKDLASKSQPGEPHYGIQESNEGKVIIFAGGIPLKNDGRIVGAIGVSGGTVEQDQEVVEAGAKAFYRAVPGY